jgi:hypothetical protein
MADDFNQSTQLQRLLREAIGLHQRAAVALYDLQLVLAVALNQFAPRLAPRPATASEAPNRGPGDGVGGPGGVQAPPSSAPSVDPLRYLGTVWSHEQLGIALSVIRDFEALATEDPVRLTRRSRLAQLEHCLCLLTGEASED